MGQAIVRGVDVVPHLRPATAAGKTVYEQAVVLELQDTEALAEAMSGCTTVIQLIGTMRKRFSSGDTYETSDIGTTRQLIEASKLCGVEHLVLLSSVGAGKPMGAYLKAKAKAEALVTGSGIDWTIFRPSAFDGAGHRAPPGLAMMTRLLGMDRYRPIPIEQLAGAILHTAILGAPRNTVLEGTSLWRVVDEVLSLEC
jgi:uncharacterized protein YbjT (DUF2867 family)